MPKIRIQCPAKINLTLKITGKRPDGFHNLESVMQTISLYDYLNIEVKPAKISEIVLSGTSSEIPYNEKNLVYKAAKMFYDELKSSEIYRTEIYIEKNIPVAAGLAGGSTDAAGTLYGLNKLLGAPLAKEKLHELCASLGSDLNFCLEGGTQMTSGRGEILTQMPFEDKVISLMKPINLGISAKEAYTKFAEKFNAQMSEREKYINDLEWAVINDYNELKTIKAKYPTSVMSGSGSTYYLVDSAFEAEDGYWIKNNLRTTKKGVTEI